MQLSADALSKLSILLGNKNPNYSEAYAVTLSDLQASYPASQGADADVLTWLKIAEQVNSGAKTPQAIAIRASNAAASALELGKEISLFGPEEQESSNAIAASFFHYVETNNAVPDFAHIMKIDARAGLTSLGLEPYAWAGAVPEIVAKSPLVGFDSDNYYDTLSPYGKEQANIIHEIGAGLYFDEILLLKSSISQRETDKIIKTYEIINTAQPTLSVYQTAATLIRNGGNAVDKVTHIFTALTGFAKNISQRIANTEASFEALLGDNSGISNDTGITFAGPKVDLKLTNPNKPAFDAYIDQDLGSIVIAKGDEIKENATFQGSGGTLIIEGPLEYKGTISNFQLGDTIDLAGVEAAPSIMLGTNNVLSVTKGNGAVINLKLGASQTYSGDLFEAASDGGGGTDVSIATIAVSPNDPAVSEGAGSETFTLTRNGDTSQAATVYVSTTDGSTVSGEDVNAGDFDPLSYQPVTFAAGAASATVGMTVNDLSVASGATRNFGIQVTDYASPTANVLTTDPFSVIDDDSANTFIYTGSDLINETDSGAGPAGTDLGNITAVVDMSGIPNNFIGNAVKYIKDWTINAFGDSVSSLPSEGNSSTQIADPITKLMVDDGKVVDWQFSIEAENYNGSQPIYWSADSNVTSYEGSHIDRGTISGSTINVITTLGSTGYSNNLGSWTTT